MAGQIQTAPQFFPSFINVPTLPSVFNPFQFPPPQFNIQSLPRQVVYQQPFYTQPQQFNQQIRIKSSSQPSAAVPLVIPSLLQQPGFPPNELLGFSYRTNFGNGAASTVVFFQGGFPQDFGFVKNSITVASDSLDPQKTQEVQQDIQKALYGMKLSLSLFTSLD